MLDAMSHWLYLGSPTMCTVVKSIHVLWLVPGIGYTECMHAARLLWHAEGAVAWPSLHALVVVARVLRLVVHMAERKKGGTVSFSCDWNATVS